MGNCNSSCLFRCFCSCCMNSTEEYKPLINQKSEQYQYGSNEINETVSQPLIPEKTNNNIEFNDYDSINITDHMLLLYGYIRNVQINFFTNVNTSYYTIPQSVIDMICTYYHNTTYCVYNVTCSDSRIKISKIATNVKSLHINYESIFVMSHSGHIYAMGQNLYGQLGIKVAKSIHGLQQLTTNTFYQKNTFRVIGTSSARNYHSFVLTANSKLYGFGHCGFGKDDSKYNILGSKPSLKNSMEKDVFWPTLIGTTHIKNKIIDIRIGEKHSLFLTNNGKVYGCGSNERGQLGMEDNNIKKIMLIDSLINDTVIAIRCGCIFSVVLNDREQIKAFGCNWKGQLGRGEESVNLYEEHKIPKIIKVNENELKVKQIECGSNHVCCLDKYDTVYCWGSNTKGQCGTKLISAYPNDFIAIPRETKLNQKVTHIACGADYTVLMDVEMNLYSFGYNNNVFTGRMNRDAVDNYTRTYCAKYVDFKHKIDNKKIIDVKCGGDAYRNHMYICVANP